MRYILEQDQTPTALKVWAGQAGLVTASFFFWNSGELEQKSHKGMLRSLLFQILDQRKDFIPKLFAKERLQLQAQ